MKRQSVIVYIKEVPEVYGNLKLLCDTYKVSYWTYLRKKFPFLLDGYEVHKVAFQSGAIEPQSGRQKENKTCTDVDLKNEQPLNLQNVSGSACDEIKDSAHICPYCQHKSYLIDEHFAHIEMFHSGKQLL